MNEDRIERLEAEIERLKERNSRVEGDKAWETSGFRLLAISLLTYSFAALLLFLLGTERFLLNALVPVLGFYLSSLSLPGIKKWWIAKRLRD